MISRGDTAAGVGKPIEYRSEFVDRRIYSVDVI